MPAEKRVAKKGPKDVDAYLAERPDDQRKALQRVRETISATVPDAEEAFVYGVPGFKLDGKSLVCYAGFKQHCGFYPMSPAVLDAHASQLGRFEIAKGTIRFQPDKPLSLALIRKLVRARVAELAE